MPCAEQNKLSALRRDEVDVVLHRETHFEDFGGLERRVLFDDPLLAMLPPGHPAGRGGRVRLADLAGERLTMISRAGKPLVFDRTLRWCREALVAAFVNRLDPATVTGPAPVGAGLWAVS